MRDQTLKKISLSLWGQLKYFAFTIFLVLAVGAFKYWLNKTYFVESPLLLFFTVIAVATWYGGFVQGVFALLMAVLFSHFFLLQTDDLGVSATVLTTRYILFSVDCLLVAAVCAAFRTTQARIQQSKQIQQSEYFLDSVVENIPNMIFVKSAKDLKFVRFNKAGEELIGRDRSELIGKSDEDFFPKEQVDAFRKKDYEVLSGAEVVSIPEEPIETQRGTRYLSTKKIPILGPDGKPEYLLGISEDITDRKEIENQKISLMVEQAARIEAEKTARRFAFLSHASAALTESLSTDVMMRAFTDAVIGEMADLCMVVKISEDGGPSELIVAHANPALSDVVAEWTAYHRKNWRNNEGIPKVVRESGKSRLYAHLTQKDMLEISEADEQLSILHRLGIVSLIVVPVQAYGKIIGSVGIASTNSKRIYDELDLSVAEDLARRMFFAIDNARLYQNAQEANRAKSSFLANISHEIRTPLGAMLGFAEILLDEEQGLSEKQRHFLATIQRNGCQLLKIVDEVLDISKVESERLYFERVAFSLPRLIDEVTNLLRRSAAQKNLELNVDTSALSQDVIVSDPTRLRQILINVIGNAIKFTERGSVQVKARTQALTGASPAKLRLEFDVIDTGIGISAAQASQLFQPFTQADSSMTRRFGGTGLGLFLSRKLAQLLGGDLVLKHSEPGKGSEFSLSVVVEPSTESLPEAETKESVVPVTTQLKGKVLVIDDSIDNREWMQYACEHLGLEIDTAEGGEVGVKKALKNKYDLILMDIQMPKMDGFAAMRALRLGQYKGPIIAVTAHAMKGDRENCLQKGFDDYLCKPLTRQSLAEGLSRHLA